MKQVLDHLQYRFLKFLAPHAPGPDGQEAGTHAGSDKVAHLLGPAFLEEIRGKTVIDFGCGYGRQSVEIAATAGRVIGLDIRESVLEQARVTASRASVSHKCTFAKQTDERADIVVSLDAFEHFGDPARVLQQMFDLLKPGGMLIVSFGPTWLHPRGGHLFSVFPWAHLLFSERALLRWRADFRQDGATRFREVAGGLNQITIRGFESLAAAGPFESVEIELVPIRRLRAIHCRLTREWTSALVRARLTKPSQASNSAAGEHINLRSTPQSDSANTAR
jgi:SAM-dependent methyltransferase